MPWQAGAYCFKNIFLNFKYIVMKRNETSQERPEAYPKPTETDAQMKNQDEYTERQSARRSENMPAHGGKNLDKEPKRKRQEHRDIL